MLAGLVFLLTACQEEVEVPLKVTSPKLVVEGTVTDQTGPYYVKLSQTADFYSPSPAPKVTDAAVTLADDAGNAEVLTHQPDQPGTYATRTLKGVIGRTYTLTVVHNGQTYQAQSKLLPVASVDKLEVRFVPKRPNKQEGYYLYFYASEPRGETTNYYRFMIYRNDSLYNGISDLLILSDEIIKGNIENEELKYPFLKNDVVRLEAHSITREVYNYYTGLAKVYSNDGGLFESPPVNPPSNVSNGALGVFRASAVNAQSVTLPGKE